MKNTVALLALLLATCSVPLPCAPDDGVDDRDCLQAAITRSCVYGDVLELGHGEWDLDYHLSSPASVRDNAGLWLECSNLYLEGDGRGTVIKMRGGLGRDWAGLRVATPGKQPVSGIVVRDLSVVADPAMLVNEQTHLVMLGSTVNQAATIADVKLRGLYLRSPVRPEVGGDCLRMVGEPGAPVTGFLVDDVSFEECDRSGWSVQRGVEDGVLRDSRFRNIGKSAIDMEPSGLAPIRRVGLRDLRVEKGSVSLAGNGNSGSPIWAEDITVSGGFYQRIGATYVRGLTLQGVTIAEVATGAEGTLMIRASEGVKVVGSTIRRLPGSVAGPAVRVVGSNGIFPGALILVANHVESASDGHVVDIESTQDATYALNEIVFSGAPGKFAGVKATATGRNVDRLLLLGNRELGALLYGTQLAANPSMVGTVAVRANQALGVSSAGLRCENSPKFLRTPWHTDGIYEGGAAQTSGCP